MQPAGGDHPCTFWDGRRQKAARYGACYFAAARIGHQQENHMNPITPDPDAIDAEFPDQAQAASDAMTDDPQETLDADDDEEFESDDDDSNDDSDDEAEADETEKE
jgi:hypothetical protein